MIYTPSVCTNEEHKIAEYAAVPQVTELDFLSTRAWKTLPDVSLGHFFTQGEPHVLGSGLVGAFNYIFTPDKPRRCSLGREMTPTFSGNLRVVIYWAPEVNWHFCHLDKEGRNGTVSSRYTIEKAAN